MVLGSRLVWAEDVEVRVRTVDRPIAGSLQRFSLDEGLSIRSKETMEDLIVPAVDLVEISREATRPELSPGSLSLILDGGDRLFGTIAHGDENRVVFDLAFHRGLAIPMDRIRACLTATASQPRWQARVDRLMATAGTDDQILLTNGDLLRGVVLSLQSDRIQFEVTGRELRVDFANMVALVLAGEFRRPPVDRLSASVRFDEGSRLTVSRLRWSPDGLDFTYFDGSVQDVSPLRVEEIEIARGRWVWLDSLEPKESRQTPLMSLAWPMRVNQNVIGGPLSVGGRIYHHGLGVHSRSIVTYDLGGQFREFTVGCGLDDSAGEWADVDVMVVVDDKVCQQWLHVRADQSLHEMRVPVTGAKTLELRVDYGANGDIQDRVNWVDAALIR